MNGSRYVVPPALPLASVFPGLLQHIIANTTLTFPTAISRSQRIKV